MADQALRQSIENAMEALKAVTIRMEKLQTQDHIAIWQVCSLTLLAYSLFQIAFLARTIELAQMYEEYTDLAFEWPLSSVGSTDPEDPGIGMQQCVEENKVKQEI